MDKFITLIKFIGFKGDDYFLQYNFHNKDNGNIYYISIFSEIVTVHKNKNTEYFYIKNCINYMKEEFKHILRHKKISKLFNE